MDETLSEIENKIKDAEARIALYRRQLKDHEQGVRKLSPMVRTSSETKLDKTIEELEFYKQKQNKLLHMDAQSLVEKEQKLIKERMKQYFDGQVKRIKYNREHPKKVKVEVLKTIEDLPEDILFEDEELFDLALMSLKLQLRDHVDIFLKLTDIKKDLHLMLEKFESVPIDEVKILNEHIPYVVVNFSILVSNIIETQTEAESKKFKGLPKYHDWWVNELWSSHRAYFALYKWYGIVEGLCKTDIQKKYWKKAFIGWLNLKRLLSQKGAKGYDYTLILDKLISKYAMLDEELEEKNITNLETVIARVAQREDFSKMAGKHNLNTQYLNFKRSN